MPYYLSGWSSSGARYCDVLFPGCVWETTYGGRSSDSPTRQLVRCVAGEGGSAPPDVSGAPTWQLVPIPGPGFSLADYRAAMRGVVLDWYSAQLAGGFTWSDTNGVVSIHGVVQSANTIYTFPLDAETRADLLGLLSLPAAVLAALPMPMEITLADGETVVALPSLATVQAVARTALASYTTGGQTAAVYRKAIRAAQALSDLDAVAPT
jgi:hypothetical protein